jgi:hypothetical protein
MVPRYNGAHLAALLVLLRPESIGSAPGKFGENVRYVTIINVVSEIVVRQNFAELHS